VFPVNLAKRTTTITTTTTDTSCVSGPKVNIDTNPDLENKIDQLTKGAPQYFKSILLKMANANAQNAKTLCDFIFIETSERNLKLSSSLTKIKILCLFNRYLNYKQFQLITKDDIRNYLNSLKKQDSQDPTHKWIGTYNTRQMVISKFFKWLYNYQDEPDSSKWVAPPCVQGIKQLSRKEKSPYKPSDIWTAEEHAVFLKYCPEKRDRCYHSVANDTSARPHELLSLRIKDVKFMLSESTGKQYAEVHLFESKTKPRTIPLIFSVPYVKDWIESHPKLNEGDASLFPSLADYNFGAQLSENALYKQYTRTYKNRYFPSLLLESSIPERDKAYIKNMLTKPWNPYIIRHSALTAKSKILKESTLRNHAGWSMTSRMPSVYLHYLGNESSKSLLEAYGIEKYNQKEIEILKTKSCPNCREENKPDSKFCTKCRMVLTYDAYNETLDNQKEKESEVQSLKEKYESMREDMNKQFTQVMELIRENPKLARVKPEALAKKR
jgi:integrase